MSNLEVQFGNGQGNMDDFTDSKEPEDAGTIHGEDVVPKVGQRTAEDLIARAPQKSSEATFDDTREQK
jgi:hypothetical protein